MLLLHDRCSVEGLGDLLVVRLVGALDLTTSQHIYAMVMLSKVTADAAPGTIGDSIWFILGHNCPERLYSYPARTACYEAVPA